MNSGVQAHVLQAARICCAANSPATLEIRILCGDGSFANAFRIGPMSLSAAAPCATQAPSFTKAHLMRLLPISISSMFVALAQADIADIEDLYNRRVLRRWSDGEF